MVPLGTRSGWAVSGSWERETVLPRVRLGSESPGVVPAILGEMAADGQFSGSDPSAGGGRIFSWFIGFTRVSNVLVILSFGSVLGWEWAERLFGLGSREFFSLPLFHLCPVGSWLRWS